MYLIILASGKGTRLRNLTKENPKCFLKINDKYIIDYLSPIFKDFSKVFIIAGYKRKKFREKKFNKTKIIINKNYKSTNMVESLFCVPKKIDQDCIVVYADIVFDLAILKILLKKKGTLMPVNLNWLNLWKKRMPYNKIRFDAENLTTDKKYLSSIVGNILGKMPIVQYMGMLKITKFDFKNLKKFYKKLKNRRIDMTNFLNLAVNKKIIKIKILKTRKFWFEIDTKRDFDLTNKSLKNIINYQHYTKNYL